MQQQWWIFIEALGLSIVVSVLVTTWVIKNGRKWGIIDDPATHKLPKVVHKTAVPRGGGIPIVAALIVGVTIFLASYGRMWGIVAGAVILAITGWIDDKYSEKISPFLRLILNGTAALCVVGVGIGIAFITNPLTGGVIRLDQPQWCFGTHCIWLVADIFAVIWLIIMQNMVGWSSGVDGQMPGFVVIAAVAMAVLAARSNDANQLSVIVLAAITAGAYLGFLFFNWYPQKIMPGYGGKSLAGFLLGVMAIMSSAKVGALLLVLGIPFVDAVMVSIKRMREGRLPVWGGREHMHHYLLDHGWGKRKIALLYWGVSGVMAIAAVTLHAPEKYFTMAGVGVVLVGIILWLQNWSTFSKQPDRDSG